MPCCRAAECAAGNFFSRWARWHRRHYERRGLHTTQQQLVEGVERAGLVGATLLDIGCGVGYLHQHLLKRGALSAVGVDLSEKMLQEAQVLAQAQGLTARATYRQGDFVALADSLPEADIVLLDKVVCCYPDAEALVRQSAAKARRVYALIYPRDRWVVRLGVKLMTFAFWLVRSSFRNYVHDPRAIEGWIRAAGFAQSRENCTALWLTQVYVRD